MNSCIERLLESIERVERTDERRRRSKRDGEQKDILQRKQVISHILKRIRRGVCRRPPALVVVESKLEFGRHSNPRQLRTDSRFQIYCVGDELLYTSYGQTSNETNSEPGDE
jgi:hypothetical protein